jgi:hypothetical protein
VRKTLAKLALAALFASALAAGCGDDVGDEGDRLPTRADEPRDSGPSGELDAEPTIRCDDSTTKVSDRPACDQCAKAKCCKEIDACDKSNACKVLADCIADCDADDFACVLTCQGANPSGAQLLTEIGYCAQAQCKTECPSEMPDSGDFDAF